ncbi:major capsid family protein [Zymobacter sp. IVIA_12111.31 C1]|uniref:major capsid family protein n=1 Tax=Zymobacter sp. IVIA_12111.31 C1 TaxID=3394854 RepID=UPI0039C229A6
MAVTIDQVLREAAARGIHYQDGVRPTMLASDSVPSMITTPNGGVPAAFTTYLDPQVVRIALAPLKSEAILPATQKGSWTKTDLLFPIVEATGEATAYGDYDNNGIVNANVNWERRQAYVFQTHVKVGDMEVERGAEMNFNVVGEKQQSGIMTLNRLRNKINFYGVEGLEVRGILNDKDLPSPSTPAGGTKWSSKAPEDIVADVLSLFADAQKRSEGTLEMDSPMVLAISPNLEPVLGRTNSYGLEIKAQLQKKFSKLRIETAPEYATANGELVQLIPDRVMGYEVGNTVFTERLRFHRTEIRTSSYAQKLSAGTAGAVIKYPYGIAQMLGV